MVATERYVHIVYRVGPQTGSTSIPDRSLLVYRAQSSVTCRDVSLSACRHDSRKESQIDMRLPSRGKVSTRPPTKRTIEYSPVGLLQLNSSKPRAPGTSARHCLRYTSTAASWSNETCNPNYGKKIDTKLHNMRIGVPTHRDPFSVSTENSCRCYNVYVLPCHGHGSCR